MRAYIAYTEGANNPIQGNAREVQVRIKGEGNWTTFTPEQGIDMGYREYRIKPDLTQHYVDVDVLAAMLREARSKEEDVKIPTDAFADLIDCISNLAGEYNNIKGLLDWYQTKARDHVECD